MANKNVPVSTLRLFHAVVEDCLTKVTTLNSLLKYGIILVDNDGQLVRTISTANAEVIKRELGLSAIDWSQSFHKSWDKVANASIDELIAEQVMNYFSNYGMEAMGFKAMNYVPVEQILVDLDAEPAIKAFTIVKVWSEDDLRMNMNEYLRTVKAPHQDLIPAIKELMPYADVDYCDIKSFELKVIYCDMNDIVPLNAQDFLRFIIYKAMGVTTLVKDRETIDAIKVFCCHSEDVLLDMFKKADLVALSESFYRFKSLFLAFKTSKKLAPYINKIRRLAVKHHKPVSGFTVANVMSFLAQNRFNDAMTIIERADNRELIKLINFALYEDVAGDHVYNIRNGKTFVKVEDDNVITEVRIDNLNWLKITCTNQLRKNLNNCFAGKAFYIPKEFKYAAPASEKQMLDIFPYGTKVALDKSEDALCIAGHWMNQGERVDLDFHMVSAYGCVGWNSAYRTEAKDIMYSGDMTSAPEPHGAVEAFRIDSKVSLPYELSVNCYQGPDAVDFKVLFTKGNAWSNDYKSNASSLEAVIDPTNAIAPAINLTVRDNMTIGFYNNGTFIISGTSLGGNHRVPDTHMMVKLLDASLKRYENMLGIDTIIKLGGGQIIEEPVSKNYYDLSAGNLTPTTLFDIVDGKSDKLYEVTPEI